MERTFFFLVFCPEASGQWRGEENSVTAQRPLHQTVGYDSLSPLPLFRSALVSRIHAFLFVAGFLLDFGMVAGERGRVSSKEETDGIQCRDVAFGDLFLLSVVMAHLVVFEPFGFSCLWHCSLYGRAEWINPRTSVLGHFR